MLQWWDWFSILFVFLSDPHTGLAVLAWQCHWECGNFGIYRYAYVEFLEVEAVQNAILLSESELHARQLKVSIHYPLLVSHLSDN
jgi:hypothetical protein